LSYARGPFLNSTVVALLGRGPGLAPEVPSRCLGLSGRLLSLGNPSRADKSRH